MTPRSALLGLSANPPTSQLGAPEQPLNLSGLQFPQLPFVR